ncbi:YdcF family protein [Microbacterium sp. KSW4-17]|uniref:YdcF family protein n=1 Tax=Microbacterium galbum TaxID=3075994 RepID=A0ABU3T6T7_9MICO|nr:YdcF family protein [Microbacterium sp. KSW4-17]MDU0367082.1 YdcF family protein [Microbacterium sp. KSW4-17]
MTTSSSSGIGTARPRRRIVAWLLPGRRGRRLALALGSTILLIAIAGLPVFVFPPPGDPGDASLVYVIGPPQQERLDLARTLRDADRPVPLLISVSDSGTGHGEARFDAAALDVCRRRGVTCETPDPFTTAGESRLLDRYDATHESGKTVVVTFTPHVARTRYIFAKCSAADVTVVGVDTDLTLFDWVFQYAYQSAAFVKAWLTPCP